MDVSPDLRASEPRFGGAAKWREMRCDRRLQPRIVADTKKPRRFRSGALIVRLTARRLERALDLFDGEALDDVAGLDVLEAGEGHAAFLAGLDLVDLVLEALERLQGAQFQHHDVVADDPDRAPLRTTPSVTRQPATLPTLEMSKTCSTSALPRKVSRWIGASMPESTPLMSSIRS